MDKKLFELGLSKRKATLGSDYVDKNLASADDFNRDFQEQMTEWCWGFGWGDDTIDEKTLGFFSSFCTMTKLIVCTNFRSNKICLKKVFI